MAHKGRSQNVLAYLGALGAARISWLVMLNWPDALVIATIIASLPASYWISRAYSGEPVIHIVRHEHEATLN